MLDFGQHTQSKARDKGIMMVQQTYVIENNMPLLMQWETSICPKMGFIEVMD